MANPFQCASSIVTAAPSTRNYPVTASTAPGDTLCAVVVVNNTTCTVSGLTDSQGNQYTLDKSFTSAAPTVYAFRCPGATGGSGGGPAAALTASTDNFILTTAAVSGNVELMATDVPGVGAVDQIAPIASGASTTPSVSATPTANNEICISYFGTANGGGSPTINSPFTSVGTPLSSGSNPFTAMAYDVLSGGSGTAQTSTETIVSANWRAGMWTFQPGSGASGNATLSGVGTLTAGATQTITAGATFTGGGTITAGGGTPASGGATLQGVGTLVAGATVPLGNPPAPVVPFFEAGYRPGQDDLNTWLYNNFWFLTTRVVFRARQAVNTQSVPVTTPQPIQFDTIDEDPFGGWNPSTFAWTAPYTGWYQVTITGWTATPVTTEVLILSVLGVTSQTVSQQNVQTTHKQGSVGTFWVYMIGGQDSVSAGIATTGTAPLTSIAAGTQSSVEIVWASD